MLTQIASYVERLFSKYGSHVSQRKNERFYFAKDDFTLEISMKCDLDNLILRSNMNVPNGNIYATTYHNFTHININICSSCSKARVQSNKIKQRCNIWLRSLMSIMICIIKFSHPRLHLGIIYFEKF